MVGARPVPVRQGPGLGVPPARRPVLLTLAGPAVAVAPEGAQGPVLPVLLLPVPVAPPLGAPEGAQAVPAVAEAVAAARRCAVLGRPPLRLTAPPPALLGPAPVPASACPLDAPQTGTRPQVHSGRGWYEDPRVRRVSRSWAPEGGGGGRGTEGTRDTEGGRGPTKSGGET